MKKLLVIILLVSGICFAQEYRSKEKVEGNVTSPSTPLFVSNAPDSTLFKKYSADLKILQDNVQKLDEAKKKFLGEYYEQLQSIQSQYQVVKMYLDEQNQKLNGLGKQKAEKK